MSNVLSHDDAKQLVLKLMGDGHVLEAHRNMLQRFWNDKNLKRDEELNEIKERREQIHDGLLRLFDYIEAQQLVVTQQVVKIDLGGLTYAKAEEVLKRHT